MAANRAPLESAHALDPRYYRGAEMLDIEQRAIIARHWQIVAAAGMVAEPGDVLVRTIAEVPVIIVRGEDGALNGFTNICRHRAGPLATCDMKGAKRLRCAYHGWTYGLDGKLLSAPEMREAEGFDKFQQQSAANKLTNAGHQAAPEKTTTPDTTITAISDVGKKTFHPKRISWS